MRGSKGTVWWIWVFLGIICGMAIGVHYKHEWEGAIIGGVIAAVISTLIVRVIK